MEAAVKAVGTVDTQLKRVIEAAIEQDYAIIVIADHGNADQMIKEDGSPHTAHTTAPVPVIAVNCHGIDQIHSGILADVSPTLLKLMGLEQPAEMTGKSLV
jgi:2,3-bisphosphoglycerate-independent phosphoglycerate mutase